MLMQIRTSTVLCGLTTLAVFAVLVGISPCQAVLVAYYTFDDADTTITGDGSMANPINIELADASGNGNTAVNVSTQLWTPEIYGAGIQTGEPGRFGQSHKFFRDASVYQTSEGGGTAKEQANTTYYVDATSGSGPGSNGDVPDGASPRSFSLWFKQEVDVTAGGSQDKLFGYGEGFSGEAFDIGLDGGGIQLRHFGGNIVYGSGFDFDGTDAGWHHLVVRVNSGASDFSSVNVILDNMQLAVSSSTTGALTESLSTGENIDGFGIGTTSIEALMSAQNGFQGWLDQFRIYDHALNNQEIADLYNEPVGLPGDFDDDGDVDGDDFLKWQRDLGDSVNLALWEANYGAPLAASVAAVPEPTTAALLICSVWAFCGRIFRRRCDRLVPGR